MKKLLRVITLTVLSPLVLVGAVCLIAWAGLRLGGRKADRFLVYLDS